MHVEYVGGQHAVRVERGVKKKAPKRNCMPWDGWDIQHECGK